MYFLKQCPRCNGDLTIGSDRYGDFISCLQCGLCKDIQVVGSGSPFVHTDSVHLSRTAALSREGYRINSLHSASRPLSAAVPA